MIRSWDTNATTDFRYGIASLSLLVDEREEGVVYAFCGKSGKSLKFLEFEKDAVWLTQVQIRHGRFPFPRAGEAHMILAGASGQDRGTEASLKVSPGSLLDRALKYMNGLGDEPYTFPSHGRVPMDNNLAESVVKTIP